MTFAFAEFRRDVAAVLDRVAHTEDQVEVVLEDGAVAVEHAREMGRTFDHVASEATVPGAGCKLRDPTPEQIERHVQALERIATRAGGDAEPRGEGLYESPNAVLIRELREERARQFDERDARG